MNCALAINPNAVLGFLAGLQPLGRVGETQDMIDAVMHLEKATFVTGEILHVDGGASAGRW